MAVHCFHSPAPRPFLCHPSLCTPRAHPAPPVLLCAHADGHTPVIAPPTVDTSRSKRSSTAEATSKPASARASVVTTPREEDGDQWGHGQRLEYWTATIFNHVRANRKGEVALALGEVRFWAVGWTIPLAAFFLWPRDTTPGSTNCHGRAVR